MFVYTNLNLSLICFLELKQEYYVLFLMAWCCFNKKIVDFYSDQYKGDMIIKNLLLIKKKNY
jgi:hypothetical protein